MKLSEDEVNRARQLCLTCYQLMRSGGCEASFKIMLSVTA